MDRSAGAALRWTRAVLLASVAMVGGTTAHVTAGGYLPGLGGLVALLLLGVLACAALLGRPASTLRVVMLVVGGQTMVHGALTALSGHRGDPAAPPVTPGSAPFAGPTAPSAVDGRRVGSLYDQLYAAAGAGAGASPGPSVPAPVRHLLADLTAANAPMALAHLAAGAVVGLWLAYGERALWTVLALTCGTVHAAVAACLASARTARSCLVVALRMQAADALARVGGPGRRSRVRRPRHVGVLAEVVLRRGPPVRVAV